MELSSFEHSIIFMEEQKIKLLLLALKSASNNIF